MSRATIEDAIHTWATTATGRPFIFVNQEGDTPELPYGTIYLFGKTEIGIKEGTFNANPGDPDDGDIFYIGPFRMTVSLNVYGEGAMDVMETLRDSIDHIAPREQLRVDGGLSVLRTEQMRDMTMLIDTQWRERAQMDIICLVSSETTETGIPEISEVEATGTIDTNSEEKTIDIDIP